MNAIFKRATAAGVVVAVFGVAAPAFSETLFKIVTVKDEIVIGLNDAEMAELGRDAGALAKSIAAKGSIPVWQYAVKKDANGDLQQAPLQKIGVLASASLRVEPYKSPLKVLPHDDVIDPGQRQPAEAKTETKAEIKPEKPAEPAKCISDGDSTFTRDGNKNVFRVSLKNSCSQAQRCKVNVYVVGSTGPIKGATTLIVPGAAAGQYSQRIWDLKVHDYGGSANVARECNAM